MNELSKVEEGGTPATTRQARQDLERSRAKMAASVEALRDDLKQGVAELKNGAKQITHNLNWKVWVAKNPIGFVAGAFAIGLLLGARRRS
jgi:ElaB/YqjD/DUF883 family membrane-anchored ribosome-binding protein